MTYAEQQKKLGERIKLYRVRYGMTQKELENRSGVSVRSISRLEQGVSVQTESLIRVLCALKLDDNLDLLVPDQTKGPSYYLEERKIENPRARKKKVKLSRPKWGDEE